MGWSNRKRTVQSGRAGTTWKYFIIGHICQLSFDDISSRNIHNKRYAISTNICRCSQFNYPFAFDYVRALPLWNAIRKDVFLKRNEAKQIWIIDQWKNKKDTKVFYKKKKEIIIKPDAFHFKEIMNESFLCVANLVLDTHFQYGNGQERDRNTEGMMIKINKDRKSNE